MFVVTVQISIQPDKVEEFRPLVCKHAQNSLSKESDCHRFDVSWDPEDDTKVFIYEMYTDKAAFETHASSDHFRWFKETAGPLVAAQDLRTWQLATN